MLSRLPRMILISLASLSIIALSTVADAAGYPATVHPYPKLAAPANPAYRPASMARIMHVLHDSSAPHTVNVVVDSPSRVHALDEYAAATANPHSALFHRFLTPSEVDQRYGPTARMVQIAESTMTHAGWHILGRNGLIVTAKVPGKSHHPTLPVSSDIWSMTGFAPHGLIRQPMTSNPLRVPRRITAVRLPKPNVTNTTVPDFSLTGENFNQPPVLLQQTTESNGDVVSVMSWNSLATSSVPAGLPINLFVTVEDPQGNFLPIQNVANLNDTYGSLVSYGTSAMPASSNTLWQMPIAAWQDVPPGDLLTLTAILPGGVMLNASLPLPAFTGPATVLNPLDGQQLNALSGIPQMPANPGPIALFAIGAPPSLQNLSLFLSQNSTKTSSPPVVFHYEDGATATEYGRSGDSEESQLDLEAAAAAAPGATIEDYVYPENDSNDPLISYLTDLSQQSSAKIASLSYGFFGENPSTLNVLMNTLTTEGITVLEASGDQGAWNGGSDPGPVGLSALEQIPSVLSVGGTDIAAQTGTGTNALPVPGSIISDAWGGDFLNGIPVSVAQAYTSQNAASSGGYSLETPTPIWQQAFLPPGSTGFGVPIISSMAGFPGMSGYLQGQNVIFGGTSVAAPLTAGWLDDVETALNLGTTGMGNVNPLLFQAAASDPSLFTQALWGQDGVYSVVNTASGSWNPLTGLGMLNWGGFLSDYTSLVPSATASISLAAPLSATVGQTVQINTFSRGLINPLFQFSYQSPQNGITSNSGAYSPTSVFSFTIKVPGIYPVQVRVKTSTGLFLQRSQQIVATSRFPMVSSLQVTSSLVRSLLPAHHRLIIYAHAQDHGGYPEYQFLIRGTRMRPHFVQGWSGRSTLTLKSLPPGHYGITVYALNRTQVKNHDWAAAYRKTISFFVR